MSDGKRSPDRLERVREALRAAEANKSPYDPDFARTYAGQWVILYQGQVVAHGTDATQVAREGKVQTFPGAVIFHVAALDKQEGVWLLRATRSDV